MQKNSTSSHQDSVYTFKDICFTVPAKGADGKPTEKKILSNISATVKSGHVLAIMGPSGAGKTTLINVSTGRGRTATRRFSNIETSALAPQKISRLNQTIHRPPLHSSRPYPTPGPDDDGDRPQVLTMTAFGGKSTGSADLNGKPLTVESFNTDCFVVTQQDNHWPFLTCEETISYAAQLYLGENAAGVQSGVDSIIKKMGLESCRSTKVGNMFMQGLSGGQKRRLSIALALVKQPTLMFLDEPTSGLDAAAAANIMREITSLAAQENLVIVATIHQPSSKVYARFDQVMILSGGREAFCGKVDQTIPYFEKIGYSLESFSNPAEFFLDLVNNDFVDQVEVDKILDQWAATKSQGGLIATDSTEELAKLATEKPLDSPRSVLLDKKTGICHEMAVMMRRHALLISRDPATYIGRAVIFLSCNLFFSLVYIKARERIQSQVLNRMWLSIWYVGVPANMGVVAVYALNEEYKSVAREIKNGMVSPASYVMAKTVLSLPIMFIWAIFALLPAYTFMGYDSSNYLLMLCVWACMIYSWECMAELLAVAFDNPLLGMLNFMQLWFSAFLFGGFLLPGADMYWPLKIFFYILPIKYATRSMNYVDNIDAKYDGCHNYMDDDEEICFGKDGKDVLKGIGQIYPLITQRNTLGTDIPILIAIAVFFKIQYIGLLFVKSRMVSKLASVKTGDV